MNVQLDSIVESLLQKYECVILPDFCCFIVRESPCNFSASGDRLKPYSKHVFFNPHLTLNDGLVYNDIQTSLGYTYNEAIQWYNDELSSIKSRIQTAGDAKFGKLGTFYQGKENHVWFSPASDLNLSKSTYGLFPVDIHKVVKEEVKQDVLTHKQSMVAKSDDLADRKPIESLEPARLNYKAWIAAAMVALMVHFTYLKLEKTDVTTNEASVLPTFSSKKDQQTAHETLPDTVEIELQSADSLAPETMVVVPEPDRIENHAAAVEEPSTPVIESAPAVSTDSKVVDEQQSNPELNETETDTQIEISYKRVARYKLEANALSHKKDLEKKGQTVKIELTDGLYEVLVEQ